MTMVQGAARLLDELFAHRLPVYCVVVGAGMVVVGVAGVCVSRWRRGTSPPDSVASSK